MRRTIATAAFAAAATMAQAQGDPALGLRVPDDSAAATLRAVPLTPVASDSARVSRALPGWCGKGTRGRRVAQTAVAGTFVGGNLALYEYFRRAWWSGEKAPFFLNYDWDGNFRDQDKLGHLIGGYLLSEGGRELLQAACMSEKKATLWAVAYAAAFQLQIELWDGTQARYGFSPPDVLFNTIGQGLSLSHAFVPPMRAVMPTISYARTQALKNTQAGLIPGDLRPTVDYSGQTYWLSIDVDTLLPARAKRLWPDLLRLDRHTITDFIDPATGADIRAQRRILLSLDIDPLKLPGSAPWWVTIKKGLRHYHFPSPAIEFRNGGVRGVPWHR
ncbi:MAG: DUF2279 domain-containing protein [Gemmatimonadaceae bacterium]|nr:DUF2279 domain-containing protein [Gemmatimonadaceae bacterium]